MAKSTNHDLAKLFLYNAQDCFDTYLPRIVSCLRQLGEKDVWWRPNPASNSAGNLALHLCGNMRQWIISGLGGAEDTRVRDIEFSERGPIARQKLIAQLQTTVADASRVLKRMPEEALLHEYCIQGFHVSGMTAIRNVTMHFSYHAGQIIYLTKLKRARDLRFTKLPPVKTPKRKAARTS